MHLCRFMTTFEPNCIETTQNVICSMKTYLFCRRSQNLRDSFQACGEKKKLKKILPSISYVFVVVVNLPLVLLLVLISGTCTRASAPQEYSRVNGLMSCPPMQVLDWK